MYILLTRTPLPSNISIEPRSLKVEVWPKRSLLNQRVPQDQAALCPLQCRIPQARPKILPCWITLGKLISLSCDKMGIAPQGSNLSSTQCSLYPSGFSRHQVQRQRVSDEDPRMTLCPTRWPLRSLGSDSLYVSVLSLCFLVAYLLGHTPGN